MKHDNVRNPALVGSASLVIFILDASQKILHVTAPVTRQFGYLQNELTGTPFANLIGRDDTGLLQTPSFFNPEDPAEKQIQTGEMFSDTMLLSRSDGTTFWAEVTVSPLSEHSDSRLCYLTTIRDVTTVKREQADLRRALAAADEARRESEQFLASMSHEIRTPMSGVLGMSQLLIQTDLDDEQKKYVASIEQSAKNLTNLIDDIQFYSRLESDRVRLEREPFSPAVSVRRAVDLHRIQVEKKGVELKLELDESIPATLHGDGSRYEQIVMQLLANAVKFTDRGTIRVMLTSEEQMSGVVRLKTVVEDTGIGITEEFRPSIFKSFTKESGMIAKHAGSGLGLAIIRKLTGLMDGTVDIESRREEGTRAELLLPFELGDVLAGVPGVQPEAGSASRELEQTTILLADDHPVNRKLVEGLLVREGATVLLCEDGQQAMEQLKKHPEVDLVLMDIHMPVMNGLEATRRIRSEHGMSFSAVPIIALTASVMDADVELYRKSGMNDVISKPFTREALIKSIAANLHEDFIESERSGDAPQGGNPNGKIVDMEELSEMVAGDPAMLLELLELFLEQTPGLLGELLSAGRMENWEEMAAAAHKLKPTFRYVGMEEAFQIAMELERYRKQPVSSPKEVKKAMNRLEKQVESALEEIRSRVAALRSELNR